MRLTTPRIRALADSEWSEAQRELLMRGNPRSVHNVFRTLANHADLYRRWLPFGNHVLYKSTLPPREREILILRIGHLCRSDYEFAHHAEIGGRAGLSPDEIARIRVGSQAPGWSEHERALIRAADELYADQFICDETWAALAKTYNEHQLMDAVFTVGMYMLVSMALNSFGVQLEESYRKYL